MTAKLEELERIAPPPPVELLQAARDQALLRAGGRKRRFRWPWLAAAVAGGTLIAITPAGGAATDWIAEVAGLGEPPTLPQIRTVPGSETAVASGTLDDGTRFEIVSRQSDDQQLSDALCFGVDWIDLQKRAGGGACTRSAFTGQDSEPALETSASTFRRDERMARRCCSDSPTRVRSAPWKGP